MFSTHIASELPLAGAVMSRLGSQHVEAKVPNTTQLLIGPIARSHDNVIRIMIWKYSITSLQIPTDYHIMSILPKPSEPTPLPSYRLLQQLQSRLPVYLIARGRSGQFWSLCPTFIFASGTHFIEQFARLAASSGKEGNFCFNSSTAETRNRRKCNNVKSGKNAVHSC